MCGIVFLSGGGTATTWSDAWYMNMTLLSSFGRLEEKFAGTSGQIDPAPWACCSIILLIGHEEARTCMFINPTLGVSRTVG